MIEGRVDPHIHGMSSTSKDSNHYYPSVPSPAYTSDSEDPTAAFKTTSLPLETNLVEYSDAEDYATGSNVNDSPDLNRLYNKDLLNWTVADVGLWLGFVSLEKFRILFIQQEISGNELSSVSLSDLNSIGIHSKREQKKVLQKIEALKRNIKKTYSHSALGSAVNSAEKKVVVKIRKRQKLRIISVNANITLSKLKKEVRKEFPGHHRLFFFDQDGERFELRTSNHVQAAFIASRLSLAKNIPTVAVNIECVPKD